MNTTLTQSDGKIVTDTRDLRAEAAALAQSSTVSGMIVRPMIEARYDPYRLILVGYDVSGASLRGIEQALAAIDKKNRMPEQGAVKRMILFLMANTKRRKHHGVADELLLSGLVSVAMEYPKRIVSDVLFNWHKRVGDEAIFTPVQAELYRALEEVSAPLRVLRAQLKATQTILA